MQMPAFYAESRERVVRAIGDGSKTISTLAIEHFQGWCFPSWAKAAAEKSENQPRIERKNLPQRLKPIDSAAFTARLMPCPSNLEVVWAVTLTLPPTSQRRRAFAPGSASATT